MADDLSFDFVATTVRPTEPERVTTLITQVDRLFLELERQRLGKQIRRSHWRWGDDDVRVPLLGSPNGLNHETLADLGSLARAGFDYARRGVPATEWPAAYSPSAQLTLRDILASAEDFGSYSISIDGDSPLTIETQPFDADNPAHRRQWTSIEGTLKGLTDYGQFVEARLRELHTQRTVRVRFDDEYADTVENFFRHRVLIYGLVTYSEAGEPLYVSRINDVQVRKGGNVRELLGLLPGLIGPEPSEEFLDRARGE